jgi:hypothetical protein
LFLSVKIGLAILPWEAQVMTGDFTMLTVLSGPLEADVLTAALEREQIESYVSQYREAALDGIFIQQRGWGEMLVRADQLDQARGVLEQLDHTKPVQGEPRLADFEPGPPVDPKLLAEQRRKIAMAISKWLSDRVWLGDITKQLPEDELRRLISETAGEDFLHVDSYWSFGGEWQGVRFEFILEPDSSRTRHYLRVHRNRITDPRAADEKLWFIQIFFPSPLMLDLLLESKGGAVSIQDPIESVLSWSTCSGEQVQKLLSGVWGDRFKRWASEYLLRMNDESLELGPLLKPPAESAEDIVAAIEWCRTLPDAARTPAAIFSEPVG